MKFEIDDKTGMVNTEDFGEYWDSAVKGLDAIDQAVKKTQEKILNKQIQEIQDSKNTISNDEFDEMLLQRKIITPHMGAISIEKIEQNQKIVDEITKYAVEGKKMIENMPFLKDDFNNSLFKTNPKLFSYKLIKEATGKNIKELL